MDHHAVVLQVEDDRHEADRRGEGQLLGVPGTGFAGRRTNPSDRPLAAAGYFPVLGGRPLHPARDQVAQETDQVEIDAGFSVC